MTEQSLTLTADELALLKMVLACHHDRFYRSGRKMSAARGDERLGQEARMTRELYARTAKLLEAAA